MWSSPRAVRWWKFLEYLIFEKRKNKSLGMQHVVFIYQIHGWNSTNKQLNLECHLEKPYGSSIHVKPNLDAESRWRWIGMHENMIWYYSSDRGLLYLPLGLPKMKKVHCPSPIPIAAADAYHYWWWCKLALSLLNAYYLLRNSILESTYMLCKHFPHSPLL